MLYGDIPPGITPEVARLIDEYTDRLGDEAPPPTAEQVAILRPIFASVETDEDQ